MYSKSGIGRSHLHPIKIARTPSTNQSVFWFNLYLTRSPIEMNNLFLKALAKSSNSIHVKKIIITETDNARVTKCTRSKEQAQQSHISKDTNLGVSSANQKHWHLDIGTDTASYSFIQDLKAFRHIHSVSFKSLFVQYWGCSTHNALCSISVQAFGTESIKKNLISKKVRLRTYN